MKPKSGIPALLALLTILGIQAAAVDPQKIEVFGTTERSPLTYAPGEPIRFQLRFSPGDQPVDGPYSLAWERTGDDGVVERGSAAIAPEQPVTIVTKLDRPGFLRLTGKLLDRDGKPLRRQNNWGQSMECGFEGGAAGQTEKLDSAPAPADFDAFWQQQRARLAAVPLNARMEARPEYSSPEVTVYAVTVDCAGPRPVTGYLTLPVDAAPGSLPAIANYAGYGVSRPGRPWDLYRDRMVFHVNAHGLELDRDDEYYREFERSIATGNAGYGFDATRNQDREATYFNGMALRVLRSLEFLKSLPQWNGRDLTVFGGSQGGLQGIWGAALDPQVSSCRIDIPWCCDLAGAREFRRLPGWRPEPTPALAYYDAVNFAPRITCPVEIMRAGLGDYTCPPSGVAVLYNRIRAPKKINWVQGSTHGYVPSQAETFSAASPSITK